VNQQQVVDYAIAKAQALGAQEVKAHSSRVAHVELSQRQGRIEKTSEARTQGLSLSVLVDDRFSSHSTSDLRPEALDAFLARAIDATRTLEPDPDRRMADREQMGSLDLASLDLYDGSFEGRTPEPRRVWVSELEKAVLAAGRDDLVSTTAHIWEVTAAGYVGFSNGFGAASASTSYGLGAELTLKEPGGKLPEAYAFYSARHLADLPTVEQVAEELWIRADQNLKSSSAASGKMPLILANRSAGRVLGAVLGPLSGGSIWQGRSIWADSLGEQIGSPKLSIYDDPTIARSTGSSPFDGDGFKASRRDILQDGVLKTFFVDLYHSRKLKCDPTTGGASNVVIPPGTRSVDEITKELPKAIRVTSFLGGNTSSTSGDFSFGIGGQLLEYGEPVQNISEMNISGNIRSLLSSFTEAANDTWTWSSMHVPTLVFDGVQFSGT
jgi:PmbA protein